MEWIVHTRQERTFCQGKKLKLNFRISLNRELNTLSLGNVSHETNMADRHVDYTTLLHTEKKNEWMNK